MTLVCAWCGVTLERPGYSEAALENETSHGICRPCSEAFASQERGVPLQQHLDRIPIPILLIEDRPGVITVNSHARDFLGKTFPDVETPPLIGKVFDCVRSRSAEGCGRTIHCSGCAIRRTVTTTFDTGEPQFSVPATLSIKSPDQISEAMLAITTVKMGGLVLLRIDVV